MLGQRDPFLSTFFFEETQQFWTETKSQSTNGPPFILRVEARIKPQRFPPVYTRKARGFEEIQITSLSSKQCRISLSDWIVVGLFGP
jgi:hypothetical protein